MSVMNYLEQFKYVICTVLSGLLTFFFPIKDLMYAMFTVFFVNFVFGVIAGQLNGEDWSWKKAGVFFVHCGLFFFVTSCVFITGNFMGPKEETYGVVKLLCWVAIWFYGTNIVRNWQLMMVEGTTMWKIAGFIYYVLTLKAVEKIPFLSEYLKTAHVKVDDNKPKFE